MDEFSLTAQSIIDRANEIGDAEKRRAYLDAACGGDDELRQQVEALLRTLNQDDRLSEQHLPTLDTKDVARVPRLDPRARPAAPVEGVGSSIGPYKLMRQIGEGGMGTVFLAEQQEPVRRTVALKVIKAGMDSAQVIARFEAERQALALMDHPHIAKVLDAGTTASGRPYFVMELVKGIPITAFCDEHRLSLRQRLELFVPVCQAIQHAHQKGILHRDIKPSNVLVASYDGKPVPKVIDFGVAKAMGGKLTEHTLFTGYGGLVGTLQYMSPEQAEFNALDIDTRSDVYSLGVLLYELLTGTTPLMRQSLKDAALTEVLRLIREQEPPRPSTRLSQLSRSGEPSRTGSAARLAAPTSRSAARLAAPTSSLATVSAQRQMEPSALVKAVRGEVDWIVMKALEKDRTRRYDTAIGLARDIQRFLADEPVEAGPPSTTYRLRKLAWRHRRGLATAALLLLLLVAGAVVSASLAVWALSAEKQARTAEQDAVEERNRALSAERTAKQAEEDSKAVLEFVQDKLLSAGRPEGQAGGQGKDVTLRQAVDAAEKEIVQAFADRPLVEASIRNTLGETYWYLGDYPDAVQQHKRALELREAKLGSDHPDTLTSRDHLGEAYLADGRTAEAIPLHEQTLKQRESKLGADHRDTLISHNHLAHAYLSAGRAAEAVGLVEPILQQMEDKLGPDHTDTLASRNILADAYLTVNRRADAIRLYKQNLLLHEAKFGPDHPDTLAACNNLADAYLSDGRSADAIPLLERTLPQKETKLGRDHPDTLASRHNLANAYRGVGRRADAIRLHQENLKLCEAKLGVGHPHTLISRDQLAATYDDAGEFAKAEPLYRQLVEQTRQRFDAEHPATAARMAALGLNLLHQQKYTEAESLLRASLKIREAKQPDAWTTFNTRSLLGEALLGRQEYAEAEPLLLSGYTEMKQRESKIPPRSKIRLREALEPLVQLYEATGKKDQADKWRKERERAANKH